MMKSSEAKLVVEEFAETQEYLRRPKVVYLVKIIQGFDASQITVWSSTVSTVSKVFMVSTLSMVSRESTVSTVSTVSRVSRVSTVGTIGRFFREN